ncbi:hypothetical protein HLB23_14240 [Nocardia uniformis]|uniref:Uncharacterized protein n=1 Tax=Nocardia uniformis TaxID=53432 RepID=A0A849C802_9NOCA|nr:hypothetical protein [Nocardia uniformis]NNH71009.1 hypothetical protein [Nocardia uniformis]
MSVNSADVERDRLRVRGFPALGVGAFYARQWDVYHDTVLLAPELHRARKSRPAVESETAALRQIPLGHTRTHMLEPQLMHLDATISTHLAEHDHGQTS